MTAHGDRCRLLVGAVLLSAAVLAPVSGRLGELLLVFGGAMFAGALSSGPRAAGDSTPPTTARWTAGRDLRARLPRWRTLVVIAVCGLAMFLVAQRTVLRHGRMAASERTVASRNPTVSGGRSAGGLRVVGLHAVAVDRPFTLVGARITVGVVSLCRRGGNTVASIPVSLSAAGARDAMGTPAFQLLDARGTPHDPSALLAPDRPRGTATHAAPPPRVLHELAQFDLASSSTTGPLSLDVQSETGDGVMDRIRFRRPAMSDLRGDAGQATCAQPGGAA